MNDSRWQQLWEQFDQLTQLAAPARDRQLATLREADSEMANELQALLTAHDQGESPLDSGPAIARSDDPSDQPKPGNRLGPWELDRLLGQGGMGQVWRGHRADGEFEQLVAIKFPVIEGSDLLRARFESERQILARLNHPHIAHLLDGGSSESGNPYLVMEWIDGEPITRYCQNNRLSTEQRLAVFLPVCDAVHHANRNLVLHRDIKPDNILVTESGQAKLLDFGIAKPLGSFASAVNQTQTALAFTPEYAAPEQIRGGAVGTAADVHALGAVLYEVLTDQQAFVRQGKSLAELLEDTRHNTPSAPSTLPLRQSKQRIRLDADIDQVVLKALHPDPERRYDTAAALAADINNWLDGRPVTARPDWPGYRLSKFIARHPKSVFAGVAAVLGLVVLTSVLGIQTQRLTLALERATAQTSRAESVSGFLGNLFNQANPQIHGGEPPELRTLLEQGLEQINLAGLEPDISANLKQTMGRALVDLGEIDRGKAILLQALDQSDHQRPLERAQLLASLAMAENVSDNTDQALSYQRAALALYEGAGDDIKVRSALAQLAGILQNAGDRTQARAVLEQALVNSVDAGDLAARLQLAQARVRMGAVHWGDGDFRAAQEQYELAFETTRKLLGEQHPRTANALYALGTVHLAQGEYRLANDYLERSLALRIALFGPAHHLTAVSHRALGALHYQSGRSEPAREHHQAALSIERELFGEHSIRTSKSLNNLALVEHDLGIFDSAQQRYRQAITLALDEYGESSERLIAPLLNLALLSLDQRLPANAAHYLDQLDQILAATVASDHPSRAFAAHLRGRTLLALSDEQAAISQLNQALSIRRAIGDGRHPHVADTLIWLARAHQTTGKMAAADLVSMAEEALQISAEKRGENDWRTQDNRAQLGRWLTLAGETARGEQMEALALDKLTQLRGADDWRVRAIRQREMN